MHLLYLQQLLVLPDTAGNSRSWEFAHQWWEEGWEISICTTPAYIKDHPDYPHPTTFPYTWHYMGIRLIIFDVDYSHMMSFRKRILSFYSFYNKVLKAEEQLPESDALLAYSAPLSVAELGRKLAEKRNNPFFLEVGDVWPDVPIDMGVIRQPLLIRWLKTRTRRIYESTTHIFPFSTDMKAQIMESGVPAEKISAIPNGSRVKAAPTQSLLAHPKGKIRLLYAGTVGVANDLSQLMEAMSILEKEQKLEIQLDVVGKGNDETRVKKMAKELELSSVQFHGAVGKKELERFWEGADIGVVCFKAIRTLEANGAAKFFDYLAAGIPVVINYEGWQAHYLKTYNCGLFSQQGDIRAFALNLKFLATYPTVRLRMGGNGRRLAQTQFDRQILARRMQEIMQEELTEGPMQVLSDLRP